jgi:hypothetical protein
MVSFYSCSKNGSKSKIELLTSSQWKIIADDIDPGRILGGQLETDMYKFYDPCDRDDYHTFSKAGTYELNNGPTKCASSDPQTTTGTWFLTDSDTKLNLSPYNNYIFSISDILELTETTLKLKRYTRAPDGTITRTHVMVFTH